MSTSFLHRALSPLAVGAVFSCATGGAARADNLNWDDAKQQGAVTVNDRDRSMFRPDGIRVGNYLVFPEAGFATMWDDNILGRAVNPVGGFRNELMANVKFESHLPRHLLDFNFGARLLEFPTRDEQNYVDAWGSAKWRLDIDHGHTISGHATAELRHEEYLERESLTSMKKPVAYQRYEAQNRLTRDIGKLYGSIGVNYESKLFQDSEQIDGTPVAQTPRDYGISSPFIAAGYRFSPGYTLLAEARYNFQWNRGTPLIDRDAEGFEVWGGLDFEISPVFRGFLKAGFIHQDYYQSNLIDINTPIFEGKLEWLVTPLMTVYVGGKRYVFATTYGESSGRIETRLYAKVEYEAMRNLVLTAVAEVRDIEFVGDIRHDQTLAGILSADWYYTKNILFNVTLEHQERTSNVDAFKVESNKITVGAKVRF